MRNKELLSAIYENFEVFHTMCFSTSLMSTYNCKEFDLDAHKIITFIGEAFELSQETINEFESCILGDMMNIGLITDYQAVSSTELLSDNDKESIELYEIKGRILEEIAIDEALNYNMSDMRIANQIKSNMKYEYFHHPYNAKLRFWQLNKLMKKGNINVTRQIAILYALGIGCEIDFRKAEENFLKCILWGDEISAVLIDKLYRKSGKINSEYHKIFSSNRPEEVTDIKFLEYWQLVKLVHTNIIAPKKESLINNELANMLISSKLSYQNKAELILNFNEKTWRNVYLLMNNKENHIGFRVKKDE